MARFILDVASVDSEKAKKIIKDLLNDTFLAKEVVTITCIDETNNNQFYEETKNNTLTKEQIENYNNSL